MTEIQHRLEAPGDALSDAELISRVRGGDLEAYGELYARHVDAARRLARQLVRGPDSDDLVSDAFAKVMGVLRRGGGPDVAFRAYLLTAVRRLHVDRIRSQSRLTTTDDLEPFAPGVPFQDTAVAQFESGAAARAFASLPERWQLVLWHLEVEGQKPAEIAVLLGMSPNSVSALAYRAREGLRQAFLAAHLAEADKVECRWVTEHLGGYVRKGLSKRDHDKVALHLDACPRCTAMYLELTEVNDNLAGIIAPLLLGGLAAGYLTTGSAGATGGVVALFTRAKDAVAGNVGPVVAGTAAAAVAVATIVAISVTDDDPPATAGSVGADSSESAGDGTTPAESPGRPSRIPAPRTSSEVVRAQEVARVAPALIAGITAPLLAPGIDATTAPADSDTVAVAGPGTDSTDVATGGPDGTPTDGNPTDGPTDGPTDEPGEPESNLRISSATVSDDAVVVDIEDLPQEPVTILVDLASDSGLAAFVPGQRTCSVDAAAPTRAVCVTSTAMARAAASQLAPSSFQAVIPLDFPADMEADFLDVTVNVLGYREIDATDNSFRFEYRPDRDPTDGPTTGVPTDGPTTGVPTDGPTTGVPTDGPTTGVPTDGPTTGVPTDGPTTEVPTDGPTTGGPDPDPVGPDLAVSLARVSEDDGAFKVQVTTPRGSAPAGAPLRIVFSPKTVDLTSRERDCTGPADGVVTCDWNGNTWVGFFEVPLGPGDEVDVSATVSLPGYQDPVSTNDTDTLRLRSASRPSTPAEQGPGGQGKRDKPNEPDKPATEPDKPVKPGAGKPDRPATEPDEPAKPGAGKPDKPAGKPEGSSKPDKPARPESAGKPAKPAGSTKPGKTDGPGTSSGPGTSHGTSDGKAHGKAHGRASAR